MVVLEQTGGVLEDVSLEVLGEARRLAGRQAASVTGVVLGDNVGQLGEAAAGRGADLVLLAESPHLKDYNTEAYAKALLSIIRQREPDSILMGATHNGTTLAASLAVALGAGLMAHVVNLDIEEGTGALLGSVPGFGGNIVAVCRCKGKPQMATVRPGVFRPLPPGSTQGRVERAAVAIGAEDVRSRVLLRNVARTDDITKAERIVVAGLGASRDLDLAKKLAKALHAEFGASRPLADKGLVPKGVVVGSTGCSLNARLVVVVGVSGAAHFISGIRDAGTVIAINSDASAQIFNHADYCVNGDLFKIIPELIALSGPQEAN